MNQVIALYRNTISVNKLQTGIFVIYLFHLSAIIGSVLGFEHWFIPKTPLNLSLTFLLLIWLFPLDTTKKALASAVFIAVGLAVEMLGVNFGLFFGSYQYGGNLGLKLGGVPMLIGINWAILVLITGEISNQISVPGWLKALVGATLMVILDFFMEVVAPVFDFWRFEGGEAPLSNYIAWFVIAWLLHAIFQGMKIKGNFLFSLHLYICQLLFFAFFYGYYRL